MNLLEESHQMGRGLNFSDNKTGMRVMNQSTLIPRQTADEFKRKVHMEILMIPKNFQDWACSLSGCDGGNLEADIWWLCGIE